ncbi:MAG TPA: methylenetetrahydrofolate reductase [Trebonia sp.]|jgi:methylenetetrahydrofolate reductase (NADPH)|nr:methylenetetrahydrofolate reductase [Trebonia sp.]
MSLLEHDGNQGALEALIRGADIEVIPLRGLAEHLAVVPAGTTLTITCSAKLGLERTLEYTALAAKAGYQVIPHLAARQVADVAALRGFVGRLGDLGVTDLYVIGGDAAQPAGVYSSAAELLEDLAGIDHGLTTIGVACYPEGHPAISDASLLEALRRKQPFATYMVSQLCFDPGAITGWLRKVRAAGIALPLHVGLAAPLQTRKLFELSLKIGVGSSIRYLTKQHGFIGNVLRGSSYQPDELLRQMGSDLSSDELAIERVHLFSFNQIAPTVEWQARITGPATRAQES